MDDDAFDADRFRADGHRVVDLLADYLGRAQRRELPVLDAGDPDARVAALPAPAEGPVMGLDDLVLRTLAGSNHLHHPGYVGHQVTAPLPDTALLAMVGALLNNGMAVYEMGPESTAMERVCVRFLARKLGFPPTSARRPTSGGSVGNLTALLAARAHATSLHAPHVPHVPKTIVASPAAHYSVSRAAGILGLGEGGLTEAVPDDDRKLRAPAVADALSRARQAGRHVIAVVASACSTATGTFDALDEIADVCEREGVWLHVDGAHGASAALSTRHRSLVSGIERADSVVWDAHKMMLVPALVTACLFRDGRRSYETFSQEASYLFAARDPRGAPGDSWYDLGTRTLECTKRMMSLELYGALALHGERYFDSYVTRMFDLARAFADRIEAAPDFELFARPEANIVCFRHVRAGVDLTQDELQTRLRRAVLASGSHYLVQTTLTHGVYLRTTLVNPRTTEQDLAMLLDALRHMLQ